MASAPDLAPAAVSENTSFRTGVLLNRPDCDDWQAICRHEYGITGLSGALRFAVKRALREHPSHATADVDAEAA